MYLQHPGVTPGSRALEVLVAFTRLGLTSFGGPIAHLGYFRADLVERRRWLDEKTYADLVALAQFLPGPASSQVGIAIGHLRAGPLGALAAWTGFTLPSALAMALFAFGVQAVGDLEGAAWLRGFKIVAVAVVANAVWGMAAVLAPDRPRLTLAIAAAAAVLLLSGGLAHIAVIAAGGLIGWRFLGGQVGVTEPTSPPSGQLQGTLLLAIFFLLLLGLPLLSGFSGALWASVVDSFYRAGSLVFGGGHVVLPMLQAEVVGRGWVDVGTFAAGYGAAQALPGPLFSFAAFLGASMAPGGEGVALSMTALGAIFLPSFLLVLGVLPWWDELRSQPWAQSAMRGINAAVVGILLAALYDPIWIVAIRSNTDFAIALAAFLALAHWRTPAWMVVILSAGLAVGLATLGF